MITTPIPARSIFIETDGWAYYVANWQTRYVQPLRAIMVRLSPRHFIRYCELKAKGRGEKTIAYLLFKRVRVQVVEQGRPVSKLPHQAHAQVNTVELAALNANQLVSLIQRTLHGNFPNLRLVPAEELRRLYISIHNRLRAYQETVQQTPRSGPQINNSGIEHC